jgi:hypothetical protein
VEHKKRGRPRLRDDREHRLEQAAAAAIAAQQSASSQPSVGPGPIRGHRRADSLRVLRSSTNSGRASTESSGQITLPAPDPRGMGGIASPVTSFGSYYQPPPEPTRTPGPLLTAFLNMDLRILKASDAFRTLLAEGSDVRGRQLSEFLSNQHEPSLQRLQSDLRDERTRRDPTFLPGIFPDQQEQNAVQNHDVEDVEILSHGFDDRGDTYTFVLPNGRTEQIQVRIRLARTTIFFATIMLYRRVPQAPLATSAFARRQSIDHYSAMAPQPSPTHSSFQHTGPPSPYATSAPGSPFSTMHAVLMTTLPPTSSSISAAYGTSPVGLRSDQGYFTRMPSNLAPSPGMYPPPPPPPGLTRSHSAISDSRPNTARERRRPEALTGNYHLPPIISSAPTTPVNQYFEHQPGSARRRTPTQAEEEEDTRKRRRLNIKEIIDR